MERGFHGVREVDFPISGYRTIAMIVSTLEIFMPMRMAMVSGDLPRAKRVWISLSLGVRLGLGGVVIQMLTAPEAGAFIDGLWRWVPCPTSFQ